MIFDTHAHYDDAAFAEDRTQLLESSDRWELVRSRIQGLPMRAWV